MRQLPPGVTFCKQRIHIDGWPHPRRVSELQVETAAIEHRRKIKVPVEEALLLRNLLSDFQPRVLLENSLNSGPRRLRSLVGCFRIR